MFKGITVILLCIACYLPVHSQDVHIVITSRPAPGTDTEDTLYYAAHRKLTWQDFKGKVRAASPSAAITFTGFSYDATARSTKDTIIVQLYLQVYFDKQGSWVRDQNRTPYALSHEQLHFDIAQLWANHFRDTLLAARFSADSYDSEIALLYWDYWRKMTNMEMRYDDETHHGTDHQAQTRWQDDIRGLLLSDSNPDSRHDE